ncbi:MAG: hypothetical protein ABIN80_27775 [Dyadobacter sp.]|uniref:hypothetical protein n=1 Tax=Dyadobacter sp. TaxID=1914288 RepID=UPI003263BAC9
MKLSSVFLIHCTIMMLWAHSATAQKKPIYPYKCFISIKNTKFKKGYLYQVTDSTIQITKKSGHLFLIDSLPELLETIPLDKQLIQVRVRSRYSGILGGTMGLLAGIAAIAIFYPMLPDDFETQFIGAMVGAPFTAISLSAIGARVANATSLARYRPAIRSQADLENLRYYSFINWHDMKVLGTRGTRAQKTQD